MENRHLKDFGRLPKDHHRMTCVCEVLGLTQIRSAVRYRLRSRAATSASG